MTSFLNAKELREQASLAELLSRLGFEPVRRSGKELMYLSMLRDSDSAPSFAVNDQLGFWFDHGTGKGGTIIDFGIAFWPKLTFSEVIEKLQTASNATGTPRMSVTRMSIQGKLDRERHYTVDGTKDIGTHPAITSYLKNRGVFDIARNYLREVYYTVKDERGVGRSFFAAGLKNDDEGWEVRSLYFKGCLGKKGITTIPVDPKRVVVFEGFINALSWLHHNRKAGDSLIILNSLSLLDRAIEKAKQFSTINIYFDRDKAGFQASKDFIKILPYASDRSSAFENYNDYNDKLVAEMRSLVVNETSQKIKRGR
ncbi:toprim domain-containing protein [Mucilaginibacter gynuensis]|uniref:Toprim domain-containing protein n=1 Tax=Mucilaginibacter gynuensis TaxID=1302236 RepID=A0ABP8GY98_9SPHI